MSGREKKKHLTKVILDKDDETSYLGGVQTFFLVRKTHFYLSFAWAKQSQLFYMQTKKNYFPFIKQNSYN